MPSRRSVAILLTALCTSCLARWRVPEHDDGLLCAPTTPTIHDDEVKRQLQDELDRLAGSETAVRHEALSVGLDRTATDAFRPLDPASATLSANEVQLRARESVVIVGKRYMCGKCSRWHLSTATGFVVSADGIVVTCRHVIDGPPDTTFGVMTASREVHAVVEILASDEASDIALLRVEGDGLVPLPLRAGLQAGETVHVLSHPDSAFWYYTSGVLARRFPFRHRSGRTVEMLDVTADFARGSSGGPVLDSTAAVVGVVRATDSVYYTEADGEQRDLQMVFKRCTPIEAVLGLAR